MNFTDPKQQLDDIHGDLSEKKAEAPDVDPVVWSWQEKAKKILSGEKWKSLKVVKSIITPFIPKPIVKGADWIGNNLKSDTMAKETVFQKIIRFLKQPTTKDGIAVLTLIIGALFSLDVDPEVLTTSALGIVTGVAGVWASVKSLIGIFKDEDKP